MTDTELNNDALLQQLGGCGVFQLAMTALVCLPYVSSAFSTIFMTFGLYNPGWRCLDNITTNANNSYSQYNNHHYGGIDTTIDVNRRGELFNQTNTQMTIYGDVSDNYTESCVGFNTMSCQNIEFSPEASTIVTEWGLVCDKSWIPSIIITIETVGYLLGGVIGGYFGDRFGRKRTIYTSLLVHGILNLLCVVSTSWQTFAAFRFCIGVFSAGIFGTTCIFITEFVSPKWRAVIAGLPLWTIGCFMFALVTIVCKNWKYVHVFNGAFCLFNLIPALIFPESLRWLIVKKKSKQALAVVEKIAKVNKVMVPNETCLALLENQRERQTSQRAHYSFINLFRKRFRLYTLILGLGYFSCDILYFATSFGLSALPGDFYVNSIIAFAFELPGNVIAWFVPNLLGRRLSAFLTNLITAFTLLTLVVIDRFAPVNIRDNVILILIILARTTSSAAWFTLITCSNELFPAILRSKSCAWRLFVSSFAIMVSPYVISGDGNDMFLPFIILALFPLSVGLLALLLPETKGKAMDDDFSVAI